MRLNTFKKFGAIMIVLFAPFVGFSQQQSTSDGHDPKVRFTKAKRQGYPGTDIHPNICLNAQSEYETTKFTVYIIPADATATLNIESGDISLDTTSVRSGDTVTVTGNAIGNYKIKATHREDNTVTHTASGTVFEFKFAALSLEDSGPKNHTDNGSYDEDSFEASSSSGDADEVEGAFISRNYTLAVETEPSGSFSQKVKASAKFTHTWSAFGKVLKSYIDGSGGVSFSVGYGPVSASINTGSDEGILAGMAVGVRIEVEDEELLWSKEKWKYSTAGKNVELPKPADYFSDSAENSDSPSDIIREYEVGSGEGYNLRVQVGISASSNNPKQSGNWKGADVISDSNINGEEPPGLVEEDDGIFEIMYTE